ncbi:solute carrier family 22 member 13 isoform X4 [Salmo salar]|uniref:Solute carrier family 22 member 13 isoform X4 n=1 Tax=Salmo salar TaxID=8030 RepID=A0A1S3RQ99_SALSA|nr:solute carrier family 22 member 13 isoform X4 [Salmo salar]
MAPLQLAVYLRLALIFFFTAFLFFLDVFTVSRAASSCAKVPSQLPTKSRTGGDEVSSSSARKQNETTGEVPEINLSLISVLLPTQDEITLGNDTERDNVPSFARRWNISLVCVVESVFEMHCSTEGPNRSLYVWSTAMRYGKRVVLLVCVCVHSVTALLPAILPQAILFLTLRCLAGVSCCCINICSFSLGVEWSLPKYRIWPPALLSFSFSLGMMALAPLAYLTHTWTQLHLALAIPQILCLPLYYYIPESPHWLLLKKRTDTLEEYRRHSPEDKRCLDLLLDTEGKDLQQVPLDTDTPDNETHTLETDTHIPKADTQTQEGNTLSHCGHMRSPTILLRLVIMSYIGLASALTYYGICLNVGRFGVDVFLAQFFSGLSEAPCLLVPFLLARCGRRPISMLSLLLSGSFCLLSLLASRFYAVPGLVMALALVGKLCMQTSVFVSLLYGIELFPTLIRQKCVGLVCLCYRVGCILNAVVSPRGETIPLAAMILYGSGPIVGAGLCLLLPETSGVPLPDSLEDCDRQPRLHLPLAWLSRFRRSLCGRSSGSSWRTTGLNDTQKQRNGRREA